MTYIGIYSSEKGLAVITDSQATLRENKWDNYQKLYIIGKNIFTGTGLADVITDSARILQEKYGSKDMEPKELADRALETALSLGITDFRIPWARTHLHVSGREKGGKGNFNVYAAVLSSTPDVHPVGNIVFDGSGSPSVIEAIGNDFRIGIDYRIYKDLDNILSFLYDTGIEATESLGVNMLFQFGFTDGRNAAALYNPGVQLQKKTKENDRNFERLIALLDRKYRLRSKYFRAHDDLLYTRNGRSPEEIIRKRDAVKKETLKLMGKTIGSGKKHLVSADSAEINLPQLEPGKLFKNEEKHGNLYFYCI